MVRVVDIFNLDISVLNPKKQSDLDYSNIIKAVNDLILSTHSKEMSSVAIQTDIKDTEVKDKSNQSSIKESTDGLSAT